MSYDLYFRAHALPSADQVRAYFASRPHYEAREAEAWYENPTTGVYFSFGYATVDDGPLIAFNINYNRPSFFGLEAEPEVASFIAAFGLEVDDPQADGMGQGPYSREGFLRGWNAGNRYGVSVTKTHGGPATSLPEATNTGIWRWNQMRESYLDFVGSLEMLPTFVPTVMLLAAEGEPTRVIRAVVWGQAMAFMLPEVDRIIVPQEDKSMRWIPYADIAPLLDSMPQRPAEFAFEVDGETRRTGLAHHVIEDDLSAGPLFDLLTRGGEPIPKLTRVAPGQVVDAEFLEG
jgi:hypothetical protein